MKKLLAALTSIVLAGVTVAGCSVGSGASSGNQAANGKQAFGENVQILPANQKVHDFLKGKRVAFVPILYKGYDLTQNWGSTMQRTFGNLGADFQVYDPNFSSDKMLNIIDDLIARHAADVLVLQNGNLGLLDSAIKKAQRAGIYTVVLNMMSGQLGDAFVGVDVLNAAHEITRRAVDDCRKRGGPRAMAIIDGPGNDPASIQWDQGVHDVLDPAGYQVATVAHSQWQNALAQQAAESVLQQQKSNICGFLVAYDLNSVTVGQTVQNASSRGVVPPDSVGVYTFDADEQWCGALRNGLVTASVAYDVQGIGESAAVATQQLLESGAAPGSGHTVAFVADTIVDKSNVDSTTIACYKGQ